MRLALVAALSLAAFAHQTAAQSCHHLQEQLRVCRSQELSPTTPAPDGGFTCDGMLSDDGRTCCASGCGEECGGEGCSDRGGELTADDCCISSIQRDGPLCSIAGKAPCVVEESPVPAPTPSPVPSEPLTPAPAPLTPETPGSTPPASTPRPATMSPVPSEPLTPAPAPLTPETLGPTPPVPTPGGEDGWVPKVGDRWQYNLDTPVNTDVDADVFFIDMDGAQETIDELHEKGKWVSCYISIGTVESWREDAGAFPPLTVGNTLKNYEEEKFLDVTQQSVKEVMEGRVKKAAGMGCDAVEPDNMSNWNQDNTGLTISRGEQLAYNKWFAKTVRNNGMVVGLKNAFELVGDLSDYFDFAVSVQCHVFDECDVYTVPFVRNDKPVFNVEYSKDYAVCVESISLDIDTIFKNFDIRAPVCSCSDSSRDLDCDFVVGYTDVPAPTPLTSTPVNPVPRTPTPLATLSPVPAEPSTPAPAPLTSDPPASTPTAATTSPDASEPLTPAPAQRTAETTAPAPPAPTPPPATTSPVPSEPLTPAPAPLTPETPGPTPPAPTPPPATTSPVPSEPLTPAPAPLTPETPGPTPPVSTPGGEDGWVPKVGDRWQYNLKAPVNTDVDADVFFIGTVGSQETIDELHEKGRWVSCYISIGTVEDWREDAGAFPSEVVGNSYPGWDDEKFLDITQQIVRDIMQSRIEKAAEMNCDAIEPDNMSNWNLDGTGLTISREEQVQYNRWIAETVHENGMKVGMKNAIELLDDQSEYFDFAINEECHDWDECDEYTDPFLSKGKPVFNVEYNVDDRVCDESNALGMDTIIKNYDLDDALCSCADSSRNVDCSDITR